MHPISSGTPPALIVDHATEKGFGLQYTNTKHRIDETAVNAEVEAAGFPMVGDSDVP